MMKIRTNRLLALVIVCLLMPFASLAAQPADQERNPFGVVEGFLLPEDVCELGAGWERIIFDWSQHQPESPDDWNTLNVDDRWLKAASDCNRQVIAVLKGSPAWATDGIPNAGVPRGLYLPLDDPDNLWANFVRRAAAYYAERGVNHFIIWNEPDISRDTYGFEFEGTLEDYARLLKVSALAAREGNPNAKIHVAGTTYWHDINTGQRLYVDRLIEHIKTDPEAEANGYYFDALTLHIYFRSETVYQITSETYALLDQHGLTDKSVWIVETNASPNLDPLWRVDRPNWQTTLEQQAAFLVHAVALGMAGGADHIGVYKFYDWTLPEGEESFGLIRVDQSRRPAFDTWKMVIEHLTGIEHAALAQTTTANVVRLLRNDGQEILIAWAKTAQATQIHIPATSDQAQLVDQYGNILNLNPIHNRYTLSLPAAICNTVDGCPVGGVVSLLIQPHNATSNTLHEVTSTGLTPITFLQEN